MRAAVLLFACACGPAPTAKPPEHAKPAPEIAFVAAEKQILGVVAVDPRVAARGAVPDPDAIHHVAMRSILSEDPTIAMQNDKPDVLSFDVRFNALSTASATFAKWKSIGGLEVELVGRFLASEEFRLKTEKDLPRSLSTLMLALAATWQAPDATDAGRHDDWLSRRLGEAALGVEDGSLSLAELQDLEDSLDPLERKLDTMPKSRAALVALRILIQRVHANTVAPRWGWIAQSLRHVAGTTLSDETLLALFATEAKLIEREIGELVVKLNDDIAARAGDMLTAPLAPCHTPQNGSLMRALEPPEERAFDCVIRARTIAAHTAEENLEVLVAMHDATVAAAWAVVIARGGDERAIALAAPKRIAPMSPTLEGKLMRFATVHPASAITHALSIEWIMRNGLAEAALRADAWRTFGDAPLDIVEREVHPRPRERNRLRQSGS